MNRVSKTLAAIVAAAGIGTGVYFATATGPTTWNVTTATALAAAEQNAKPSDTVLLSGTFHVSLVPKVSGTATAPIVYKAASCSTPPCATFDAAGLTSTLAAISGRSYLTFSGLAFVNSAFSTAPATNRGVILRSSSHITITGCSFSHMQAQLIASSDNAISGNYWRYFVASYVNGQPRTAGDMLNLVGGSSRNVISGNDMKYAGHSLIEVGNGFGGQNAANVISGNTLSNPWYKPLILADDGGGTVVEQNRISDANSVPTLLSTLPQAYLPASWPKDGKAYAQPAVQLDGKNYILRNNTIDNATSVYGTISMGARWYYGQGAPPAGTTFRKCDGSTVTTTSASALVESCNNQIYGNTFSSCKGAATFSFEQNYTLGTDLSVPNVTGNLIYGNSVAGAQPTAYSWDGTLHYETVLYRSFRGAGAWTGLGGNQFYANTGVSATGAYRSSYVSSSGATSTKSYPLLGLQGFQALDPANVYGNS